MARSLRDRSNSRKQWLPIISIYCLALLQGFPLPSEAASSSSSSSSCDSTERVIWTSLNCPSNCTSDNCALYTPASADSCLSDTATCATGEVTFPDGLTCSSGTYQCLDDLDDGDGGYVMVVSDSKWSSYTTVPLTGMTNISVPSDITLIQITGTGTDTIDKGTYEDITYDTDFFYQYSQVNTLYLFNMALDGTLPANSIPTSMQYLSLINCNLSAIPEDMKTIETVTRLNLSYNYLESFPDSDSEYASALADLNYLDLQYNDLSDFDMELSLLEYLDLSGNKQMTSIPDVIFNLTSLTSLYMTGCGLTNLELTESQISFLNNLDVFDASISFTSCSTGAETELSTGATVCNVDSTSSSTSSTSSSGTSTTTIVIIVVCVVVGVLVIAGLVYFFCFRRRVMDKKRRSTKTGGTAGTGSDSLTAGMLDGDMSHGSSSIWNDPDLLAVRVELREIDLVKLISRGGFGEVWMAKYLDDIVAVKRLLPEKKTMPDAIAFATEIKTMARLEHPKIVRFIGVAWSNALSIQALTEFMDSGDLKSLLDSPRAKNLTWASAKLQIAIDVADALVYLHTLNPKLIHRDLKSRNVLIDAKSGAKLSDFGISRNRSFGETMTAGVGTARWIAPEVILGGHYTESADIYSFGVVLSELDTCHAPYEGVTNTNGGKIQDVTVLQLVSAGKLKPTLTDDCPDPIREIAQACLEFDPSLRPNAIHVSFQLRKARNSLQSQ